jgi:hypothetical protein
MGYPLKGQTALTPKQKNVVDACRPKIRKELNKLGRLRKGAGILGYLLLIFEMYDVQQRANASGKDVWQQYIEDFYGTKDDST